MKSIIIGTISLLFATCAAPASAQCVNPITPNCDFYERCLERYCHCGWTSSSYALTYGQKYCKRFIATTSLSPSGKKWRDATLLCLQEKLVPIVPIDNPASCDCAKVRDTAYRIHAACYSQPQASICDLSVSDLATIDRVVDDSDKFDKDGLKALRGVLSVCMSQNPAFSAKAILAKIENLLR
jgi:hypothetical protein